MDNATLEKARDVGKISYKALGMARELVKPGAKLIDVAERLEGYLDENGYGCAFPLNLSVNSEAAHYTPALGDEKEFSENDIVKVDFGAAKDGLLGDCAFTIDLSGERGKLIEATDRALDAAISKVKAGVEVRGIGRAISEVIESYGFKPIRNLGGHGVGKHDLHSEIFIPNFDNGDTTKLEEGRIIAIEPFATTAEGKGVVHDSDTREIYGFAGNAQVRSRNARDVLSEISSKYPDEPFAARWLSNIMPAKFGLYSAMRELLVAGAVESYPMLVEAAGGMVSQSESEVLVTGDSCEILTK